MVAPCDVNPLEVPTGAVFGLDDGRVAPIPRQGLIDGTSSAGVCMSGRQKTIKQSASTGPRTYRSPVVKPPTDYLQSRRHLLSVWRVGSELEEADRC